MLQSTLALLTTTTLSIDGVLSRAMSAVFFKGINFPLLKPPSAVTRTLAWVSLILSARAWALKPENTTVWIAPILAVANMVMGSSGIRGRYIATLSPFLTLRFLKTEAKRFTSV